MYTWGQIRKVNSKEDRSLDVGPFKAYFLILLANLSKNLLNLQLHKPVTAEDLVSATVTLKKN